MIYRLPNGLRFGQPPAVHVHLQGMQDQPAHRQGCIANGYQFRLGPVFRHMHILGLLVGHGRRPPWFPPAGLIVMTREDADLVRQGEDCLDRVPQDLRISTGEPMPTATAA